MKTQNTLLALVLLASNTMAFAHCPTNYKAEKACLWLDKNMLFIYDHKVEHNGPYKDLEKADVTAIKSLKGEELAFKKIARGIFKLESPEVHKSVMVVVTKDKKKSELKVSID